MVSLFVILVVYGKKFLRQNCHIFLLVIVLIYYSAYRWMASWSWWLLHCERKWEGSKKHCYNFLIYLTIFILINSPCRHYLLDGNSNSANCFFLHRSSFNELIDILWYVLMFRSFLYKNNYQRTVLLLRATVKEGHTLCWISYCVICLLFWVLY